MIRAIPVALWTVLLAAASAQHALATDSPKPSGAIMPEQCDAGLHIVQICFKHPKSNEDLKVAAVNWAKNVKPTIAGLKWKMFVNDPAIKESCGIYLFDSLSSARAYTEGDLVSKMRNSPDRRDMQIRVSELYCAASVIADAPIQ